MWAVPWSHWLGGDAGGVFYEHFHRLLGTVAGFAAVGTVLAAFGASHHAKARRRWGIAAFVGFAVAIGSYVFIKAVSPFAYETNKNIGHLVGLGGAVGVTSLVAWLIRNQRDERVWVRRLAVGLLVAVCLQGLLGGLRVVFDSTDLAMVHGIFGQLTLCVGGLAVIATSRWWQGVEAVRQPSVSWPAVTLLVLCVGQLVIAAAMRHNGAGLAVPDWPTHYGQIVPPTDASALQAVNVERRFDYHLPAVSLAQVWLHVAHRLGAYLICGIVLWVTWRLWNVARGHVLLVLGLVGVQVTLGVATVWLGKPADIATLHVATGALLLLTVSMLAARLIRQYGLLPAPAGYAKDVAEAASPSPYAALT